MLRKILLGVLALVLALIVGVYALFAFKGDVVLQKFSAYVEEATGAPLLMETLPKLSIFPSPGLDLGKASWGKKDEGIYVSFSKASVRLSGSALMTGDLRVTAFAVDDLDLIVRAAPASPGAADKQPGGAKSDPAQALGMIPDNISVTNGRITLIQANGESVTLSKAHLALEDFSSGFLGGKPAALDVRGTLESKALAGDIDVAASLARKNDIVSARIGKARLAPAASMPFKDAVSLEGEAAYGLKAQTLDLNGVKLAVPGMKAEISGKMTALPKLPAGGGADVSFSASGDARPLFAAVGASSPFADPEALSRIDVKGKLVADKGLVRLLGLEAMLDGTPLNADLDINLAAPAVVGKLAVGDLKLDRYLPAPGPSAAADAPKGQAEAAAPKTLALPWPEADLAVSVKSLELRGVRLDTAQIHVRGKAGAYTADPFSFNVLGGPVTMPSKVVLRGKTITTPVTADVSTDISAPGIDLAQASVLAGKPGLAAGSGALNASLAVNTGSPDTTLSGNGSFSAAPITLGVNLLPKGAPNAVASLRRVDTAKAAFEAQKGVIRLTQCDLNATAADVRASGTISLPARQLDIAGKADIPGLPALPLRLSGPFSSPSYGIDASKALESVAGALQEGGSSVTGTLQQGGSSVGKGAAGVLGKILPK